MCASCVGRYVGADGTAAALAELCPPPPQQGNAFVSLLSTSFCTTSGIAIIVKTFRFFFKRGQNQLIASKISLGSVEGNGSSTEAGEQTDVGGLCD